MQLVISEAIIYKLNDYINKYNNLDWSVLPTPTGWKSRCELYTDGLVIRQTDGVIGRTNRFKYEISTLRHVDKANPREKSSRFSDMGLTVFRMVCCSLKTHCGLAIKNFLRPGFVDLNSDLSWSTKSN